MMKMMEGGHSMILHGLHAVDKVGILNSNLPSFKQRFKEQVVMGLLTTMPQKVNFVNNHSNSLLKLKEYQQSCL